MDRPPPTPYFLFPGLVGNSEKQSDGSALCLTIRTRFASVERPMLNHNQILLPIQALQLGRSYNGRILVNVDISVRQSMHGETVQQYADIHEMCIGELPVLTGSCICHRPRGSPGAVATGESSCFFIVSGQCKVIVSQERPADEGGGVVGVSPASAAAVS